MLIADDILARLGVSRETIAEFCRRWQITELAVFGSAARGEMRADSDIDVMVEFGPEGRWSLFDMGGMQQDLVEIFRREVDLVKKGPIPNPYKRKTILRDLTVVYEA